MKKLIIILDPAHGADVKGKCSPDGVHREYRWSRDRVKALRAMLVNEGYEVYVTTESENEPGLSKRKNFATQIRHGSPKLLISPHNNAAGSNGQWLNAQGAAIYTTKGKTNSDVCADIILKQFEQDFPEIKIRKYTDKPLERDFEENFTVISGNDYWGVLIEWLFQDNKQDVEKLLSPTFNSRFEKSLVEAIGKIEDHFFKK